MLKSLPANKKPLTAFLDQCEAKITFVADDHERPTTLMCHLARNHKGLHECFRTDWDNSKEICLKWKTTKSISIEQL